MAGDLNSYIASRYLVAETKPMKKRKRKQAATGGDGLLITDDDDSGWTRGKGADEGDEAGAGGLGAGAATVAGTSAEFRKTKKTNWTSLSGGGGGGKNGGDDRDAAAAADAIISAAAADTEAALAAEDEAPVVAGSAGGGEESVVKMSDGTHAGLQSAATVMAQLERRRREEREQYEEELRERRERRRQKRAAAAGGGGGGGDDDERSEGEEEVVYRDATGRRVDVAMRRQQVRQAVQAAEDKERAAREALRGDVQREDARRRREQLEEAALMPLARGADDEEMNRELRSQARWNDPMAQFLPADRGPATGGGGGGGGSAAKGSAATRSGRPVYKGPATPNRYGIRPGYRWDGVDRSNGFEADRFKAINRRERNKGLEYAWQMDE